MFSKAIGQRLHQEADGVSRLPVWCQTLFFRRSIGCKTRWRKEPDVNGPRSCPERRAQSSNPIGECDDRVEINFAQFAEGFGSLAGDIDARLGHHANGIGVESVGLDSGRMRHERARPEFAGPAFGHLAATRVAGTKEEDS